jgi:hypothetical protein
MTDKDDQMYVYKLFGISMPRKVKAVNYIRQKLGPVAKIGDDDIKKAQRVLDNPPFDYEPTALEHVEEVENIILSLKDMGYERESEFSRLTQPIAQIKGHAGMFGNSFVSEVTIRLLSLMEQYKRLDNDMLYIISAWCRCVNLSYEMRIYSMDNMEAQKILTEFDGATERYIQKFKRKTNKKPD